MDRLAELAGYAQSFPGMADDDFIAAGFTPEEISSYRSQTSLQPMDQADRSAILNEYGTYQQPDYTLRERTVQGSQDILSNTFGMNPYSAGVLSRNVLGDPNSSGSNYGMGIADFTPLGAAFAMQEGSRTASSGYEAGDPVQMGLGGLEVLLGVAEGVPIAGRAVKPLSKAVINTVEEVFDTPFGGEVLGYLRGIRDLDADFLRGRGDPALAQGVGADVVGADVPLSSDKFLSMAQSGEMQQARTIEKDIADITSKKMPANVLDIRYADEDLQIDYESGELTQRLEDAGLFVEDDKMGIIYAGTTLENIELIKNAQTPYEFGKAYGYSDDDIAKFYLQRRGGQQDLAYDEYIRDRKSANIPNALIKSADVPGRAPLTFDEVEAAMREEEPYTVPAQARSPEPPQSNQIALPLGEAQALERGSLIMPGDPRFNEPIDQMPVTAPRITPRDLEGARIIPTVADLTRAGGFYRGIDSSLVDIPEVMMGGPGFPLLPSSQENGLVWAVQGAGIGTKKAGKGADLIAITAMNPTSHKSNISFINSLIKTTDAYVRDGRIGSNVINVLDDAIRQAGAGGDQALVGLARFPGFNSPNSQEFINNASFQERSRIASIIGSKDMQKTGVPNVNRVLQETTDPLYAGANPRDTLLFIEPDFSLPPVDLAAEGLPVHPSYRYGIRGRVFGALDQNISTFEMFPDFWGEKNINAFGEGFNTGGRRAYDMGLPIQNVTGEQVENLERMLRFESNQYPVGSAARLSPIDTRIVTNSMLDKWKPTTTSVKAGGASPQAFVDAIKNNKYSPALTSYSPQELRAGARSGDLVAYQLGDDDVFFALDSKPDYSWAGVDMQEGDKALVGVVSNAPGSKGTAAPSVIAKALDEGANILDAFAVPSKKFPNGFLPQYYRKFGFEEAGRVPFDKDMYVADHGEIAYEDLLEAWRSDGWDESMGMPPVIVMRWSGSDADRAATSAGLRGAGSTSHRFEPEGIIPEARGSAGRSSERPLPGEPSSVGRGDTGGTGVNNGLRVTSGAGEVAEGLLGLTPEQLRNRGIPEATIQELIDLKDFGG